MLTYNFAQRIVDRMMKVIPNQYIYNYKDFVLIHRNSLNYRLQKIQDITGKNTKNYLDLFQLFSAYTIYKLDCKEGK